MRVLKGALAGAICLSVACGGVSLAAASSGVLASAVTGLETVAMQGASTSDEQLLLGESSPVYVGKSFASDGLVFQIASLGDNPTVSVGTSGATKSTALADDFSGTGVAVPARVSYQGVDYAVTSISNYAFSGTSITEVSIPGSVAEIGANAFRGCTALSSLDLAEGLETLNNSAFNGCTALTSVNVPSTVEEMGTTSGDYTGGSFVFYGCTSLKTVTFGKGMTGGSTSIASRCFTGCNNLETVDLNNNVATLNANCFHTLPALKYVTGIDAVTYMGRQCFCDCTALVRFSSSGKDQVDLTNEGLKLRSNIFSGCESLGTVTLADGVDLSLDGGYGNQYGPFRYSGIKKAVLEGTWETIPQGLFLGAASLESVSIPQTNKVVGISAFSGCESLKSISLSKNLTSVGNSAFNGCISLVSATIEDGCVGATFGTNCFIDCASLQRFEFPEGTTTVPDGCFSGCSSLEYVKVPDSVTSIGAQAFSSVITTGTGSSWVGVQDTEHAVCEKLATLDYSGKPTDVGAQAFYGCKSLEGSFDLSLIDEVPDQLFTGCAKLGQVTLSATTKSIGGQAFCGCNGLTFVGPSSQANGATGIVLPDTVTKIGQYAFSGCSSVARIVLPEAIGELPSGAFYGCSSVEEVALPDSVTSLGKDCFGGCVALKRIAVPSQVTELPSGIFEGCTALAEVTLPDGMTSIGEAAFQKCPNLLTLKLPQHMAKIAANAFAECQRLAWIDFTGVLDVEGLAVDETALATNNTYSKYIFKDTVLPTGFKAASGSVYQVDCGSTDFYGSPVTPYRVLCDGKAADSSDYRITYSGNTSVGLATAQITIGSCTFEREFTIAEGDWSALEPAISYTSTPWTGTAREPEVTVEGMRAGIDFKVAYTNNTNIGTATVTVTPLAISGEAKQLSFAITLSKGATCTAGNLGYQVTNAKTNGSGTVSVVSFKGTTAASVPATVSIGGASFKVTAIAASAFKGNKKLKKLTIGANVTSIAASSFNGCSKLAKVLFAGKKAPSIGANAFKSIYAKAVIGTKGNATTLRKLLLKKGLPKTATVVKA